VTDEKVVYAERLPLREEVGIPDVAAAKGMTRAAILYAVRVGKLPARRPDGRRDWLIRVEDALRYLSTPRYAR